MCYRLLQEYFDDEDLYDRLVAVYAIGWPCTKELVEKYGIQAAPTLILFNKGEEVSRIRGAVKKDEIITLIKEQI